MTHDIVKKIKVLFIAGFGPIVTNQKENEQLFKNILGLPLETIEGYDGYLHSEKVQGVKCFALWPLDKAAMSCFGTAVWPESVPVPQAWLEIDVADISSATLILEQNGYQLLTRLQEEPWGQTVTRFLSPDGILMAIAHTPFLRDVAEK